MNEYGYKGRQRVGHTVCAPGKRVLVTLYSGEKFVDKFKLKEGRFHYFFGHPKMKSNLIKSLSILTADYKDDTLEDITKEIKK